MKTRPPTTRSRRDAAGLPTRDRASGSAVDRSLRAERYWFGYTFAGDPRYADVNFGMAVEPHRSPDQIIAGYQTAIDESDARVSAAAGPDVLTAQPVGDAPRTLRWVLAHVTSETVRHAGHADILREPIDGVTGR